jgi:hypothetical protein
MNMIVDDNNYFFDSISLGEIDISIREHLCPTNKVFLLLWILNT